MIVVNDEKRKKIRKVLMECIERMDTPPYFRPNDEKKWQHAFLNCWDCQKWRKYSQGKGQFGQCRHHESMVFNNITYKYDCCSHFTIIERYCRFEFNIDWRKSRAPKKA